MSKEQYEEMVMKHLNTDTYEQVADKNIDKKVMAKTEDFTNDYSDILEPEETKYLTDFKYSTSNFYVLPKVHKSKEITRFLETSPVDYLKVKDPLEIPSRPIVAGPNSPTHQLSTFLDIILCPPKEIVDSYVRDDSDFLHHLPNNIDFDSTFISLDVTSLYTNITHDRGIEAISYWIDQYPSRAFKNKPLLSTRQPPNLKRLITRAEYNPEEEQGVIPCTRPNCDLCRLGYLKIQTEVKSPTGTTLFKLYKRFHCNSMNILYLLTSPVCNKQYVGKTEDC